MFIKKKLKIYYISPDRSKSHQICLVCLVTFGLSETVLLVRYVFYEDLYMYIVNIKTKLVLRPS